ncbi:MAG: hypothetical protein NVSMB52_16150 [Chloroflexota bacterium]
MAKRKQHLSSEQAAERKVADAQAKLQSAQLKRAQAISKGEQTVERARQRAAVALEKATREVERRAAKVARAEARLAASRPARVSTSNMFEQRHQDTEALAEPADDVEILESRVQDEVNPQSTLTASDPIQSDETGQPAETTGSTEQRLLASLSRHDISGATFTEWLSDSGLSKKTFLRARQLAVEHGLVTRDGNGRGARYRIVSNNIGDPDKDPSTND